MGVKTGGAIYFLPFSLSSCCTRVFSPMRSRRVIALLVRALRRNRTS
jgi:hypothetical protein